MAHYDMDIHCKICGKYLFSVFTYEGLEGDYDICDDCHPDKKIIKMAKDFEKGLK